jgi:O-antigen/teichoic acid export membrane protein
VETTVPQDVSVELDSSSLLRGSVRGGMSIVLARGGADAIRLLSMLVLARLLTPEEFGIVAMVVVVVGIADVIQDLGLSSAAVQRKDLTAQQASTMFWLNIGLGLIGTIIVYALADEVASLVDDARVADVARLLSPMFLLSALGTQHMAMLRRELRFTTLASIRITGALAYGVTSIGLAVAGIDEASLVWGLLISNGLTSAMAFATSSFVPGRPKFDRSTREMAGFGANLAGFVVLNYLAVNVQALVIGRAHGASATGVYGRAQRLVAASTGYLLGPVTGVAFPVMARLVDDPDRWARYYHKAQTVVVVTTLGIAPLLVVYAHEIVQVLLGRQWEDAAPVLAILGVGVAAQGLCSPTGWIYQSRGDTHRMLRWGMFGWTVVLTFSLAGVPYGIEGVAAGSTIAFIVLIWPCLAYAFRGTPLTVASVLWPLLPVALAATAAAAVSVVVSHALDDLAAWAQLIAATLVHVAVYVSLLALVPNTRDLLATVLRQLLHRRVD